MQGGVFESGVRIDNPNLTESVERQPSRAEEPLHERVADPARWMY